MQINTHYNAPQPCLVWFTFIYEKEAFEIKKLEPTNVYLKNDTDVNLIIKTVAG